MILLAYITSTQWACQRAKRYQISPTHIQDIALVSLFSGVLGARIAHFILYNQYYESLFDFIKINDGGLVLYGFFLTTPFVLLYKLKKLNITWNDFFMIFVPVIPLGIGIGRIGCFFSGCCYGKPGEQLWCVTFPMGSVPHQTYQGAPIHPSQIYAFLLGLGTSMTLAILPNTFKNIKGYHLAAFFLLGYGLVRIIEESFRGDTPLHFAGLLTAGQSTSLLLILTSFCIFFLLRYKKAT